MLTQTERSSTRFLVLAFAFVVVGMIGLALRSASTESSQVPSSATAVFTVGGTAYEFAPTSCTITATDFLAAGPGQLDGEDFWISVSPEAAEVALGTADERTRSDDVNDAWYRNNGIVDWTVTGDTVEATLALRNERMPDSGTLRGHFSATCS